MNKKRGPNQFQKNTIIDRALDKSKKKRIYEKEKEPEEG